MIGARPPMILSGKYKGVYARKKGKPKVTEEYCPACGKKLSYFKGTYGTGGTYDDLYCVCMHCGGNFRYFDGGDGGAWYRIGDAAHEVEVPGDA